MVHRFVGLQVELQVRLQDILNGPLGVFVQAFQLGTVDEIDQRHEVTGTGHAKLPFGKFP